MSLETIIESINRLKNRHKEYIQSSYHIRHERLIYERQLMLENSEGRTNIMADPFLEAPPRYSANSTTFEQMNLPKEVRSVLNEFAEHEFGVYDPPYEHQAEALEKIFTDEKDVIVVTGTGSGKTEVFTYSILGKLAQEGAKKSSDELGVRTLVLYPMNALVSDQLTRIRKMFGIQRNPTTQKNPQEIMSKYRTHTNRPFRFAMYTGRTPYHGSYDKNKNNNRIKPIVDYFLNVQKHPLGKELEKMGRIPQKDLSHFRKEGGRGTPDPKYRTHPDDAEYLTRQEMLDPINREHFQGGTPELLITNYSMLEYMLIRPIEQPIIEDTKQWLKNNPEEKLLIVMDEAHLYRGSGGAEVALLLRRLMNRLGIESHRIQFILTSASFSGDAEIFAEDLTQKSRDGWHKQGARPIQYHQKHTTGDESVVQALVAISNNLQGNPIRNLTQIQELIDLLLLPQPSQPTGDPTIDQRIASQYLGEHLKDWEIFRLFADEIGKPKRISDIAHTIFPNVANENLSKASEAVLQLGNLGSIAREPKSNQPLLPTRLHLFFRGLPHHYICVNHTCSVRLAKDSPFMGRIYLEPRLICDCSSRIYELETCRDCGTAYLHAFANKTDVNSLIESKIDSCRIWNQPFESGGVDLHLMPVPDGYVPEVQCHFLDPLTGVIYLHDEPGRLKVILGTTFYEKKLMNWKGFTFQRCIRCRTQINIGLSPKLKIQNLETTGEQPLSNIVSELFQSQPERQNIPLGLERKIPNKGKKVLVFSDSRSKASRLAANLQNDVEFDALRTTLFKSLHEQYSNRDNVIIDDAWKGFLWYCSSRNLRFFDKGGRENFNESTSRLFEMLDEEGLLDQPMNEMITELSEFNTNLFFTSSMLRIFGDGYFSMFHLLVGYLEPIDEIWAKVRSKIQDIGRPFEEIQSVIRYIMKLAAFEMAIDPNIKKFVRDKARRSPEPKTKVQGLGTELDRDRTIIPKDLTNVLIEKIGWRDSQLEQLITILTRGLGQKIFVPLDPQVCGGEQEVSKNRYVINPKVVKITTDLNLSNWNECTHCLIYHHSKFVYNGFCLHCGKSQTKELSKENLHVNTRFGFFRNEIERKFNQEVHPLSLRAEEHTAQVNNRDINSGQTFSHAERYELEFQDVMLQEDARMGRDQPVDVLSCTTTMEVGIDIGGLTAVAMRTVPPRPDNYQQRSGRAGRRGSTLSTIVTYANNSPHEQFYFLNPGEIIGKQPKDPFLQIDNIRLAERHVNAMLIQLFFTVENTIPQEDQNVFESIGLTEEFFDLTQSSDYNYSSFKKWLLTLDPTNEYYRDICTLLPGKLANRLSFGGNPKWRDTFVKQAIELLISRLDDECSYFTKILKKRRTLEPGTMSYDPENSLVDFLLRQSYLPSFAFPIDVCSFSVLQSENSTVKEIYSPDAGMSQALSLYAPGKEIHINKEKYQSAGLYVPFPNNHEHRFSGQIDDIKYHVMICDTCHALSTYDRNHQIYSKVTCENCKSVGKYTFPMYTPIAFAPISDGFKSKQAEDRNDIINQRKSSVLLPLSSKMKHSDMEDVFSNSKIVFNKEEEFFQLNTGPTQNEAQLDTNQDAGWEVCDQCGTCKDVLKNPNNTTHPRVYPRINQGPNRYSSKHCDSNQWRRIMLGYNFRTDMMLLQTVLDPSKINFSRMDDVNSPLYNAALSAKEGILAAITRGNIRNLDMDDGEINGHFRIIQDDSGTDDIFLEFYLFDTAPGGAGYSQQVKNYIEEVVDEALATLESCNCESSCHYCLRTYKNQYEHLNLNRHWGASVLHYIRDGFVSNLKLEHCERLLHNVLKPNLESIEEVREVEYNPLGSAGHQFDIQLTLNDNSILITSFSLLHPLQKQNVGELSFEDYEFVNDMPAVIERLQNSLRPIT